MKTTVPAERQLSDDYSNNFYYLHQSFIDEERDATVRENAQKLVENADNSETLQRLNTGVASDVTYLRRGYKIKCHFQVPTTPDDTPDQSVQDRFEIFTGNKVLVFGNCSGPAATGLSQLVDPIPKGTFGYQGVLSEIDRDRVTVVFDSVGSSPEIEFEDVLNDINKASSLHIGVLLNPVPFDRKESALSTLSDNDRKWGILMGETSLQFDSDVLSESWPHDDVLYENEAQERGIRRALTAEDVAVLHGPPGTGKTRVIVELVRRLVEADKRVLVACETNTAVCNLLIGSGPDEIDERSLHYAEKEDGFAIHRTNAKSDSVHPFASERYGGIPPTSADVVASTLSSAAPLPDDLEFDFAIVDEATQATKGSTAIAMIRSDATILVGDHRQLPPFRHSPRQNLPDIISRGRAPVDYNLPDADRREKSIFEHLYGSNGLYGDDIGVQFASQYRMHDEIAQFPSTEFYDGNLITMCDPEPISDFNRISLVDVDGEVELRHDSKYNQREARAVENYVNMFLNRGIDASEIGVATSYRAQADYLQLQIETGPVNQGEDVMINTFDGFQGSERDVMILSFVRSNEDSVGFLSGINGAKRLNVALTRAKRACVLIGNWNTLRNCSGTELYKDLYEYAREVNE